MEERMQQSPDTSQVSNQPLNQEQAPIPSVENQFLPTQPMATETSLNQQVNEQLSETNPTDQSMEKENFSILKEIVLKKLDQQEEEIKKIREALLHEGFIDAHQLVQQAEKNEVDFKNSGKQWTDRNLGNPNTTIATAGDANLQAALSSIGPLNQPEENTA